MDALLDGYRQFRRAVWPGEQARYAMLAEGQAPHTLVIACSDSRVDPQTVFHAGPGALFVVRNVAALVAPYAADGGRDGTAAALEFGVRVLRVGRIAVLGHARCGGVHALAHGAPPLAREFVAPWMAMAAPAVEHAQSDDPRLAEEATIALSVRHLLTYPWIGEAVAHGRLQLDGFRFDIASGTLTRLMDGQFERVDEQ